MKQPTARRLFHATLPPGQNKQHRQRHGSNARSSRRAYRRAVIGYADGGLTQRPQAVVNAMALSQARHLCREPHRQPRLASASASRAYRYRQPARQTRVNVRDERVRPWSAIGSRHPSPISSPRARLSQRSIRYRGSHQPLLLEPLHADEETGPRATFWSTISKVDIPRVKRISRHAFRDASSRWLTQKIESPSAAMAAFRAMEREENISFRRWRSDQSPLRQRKVQKRGVREHAQITVERGDLALKRETQHHALARARVTTKN